MESVINKSFIPSAVIVSVVAPFSLLSIVYIGDFCCVFCTQKRKRHWSMRQPKGVFFCVLSDQGEKKKPATIVDVFGVKIRLCEHCQGHQPAILIWICYFVILSIHQLVALQLVILSTFYFLYLKFFQSKISLSWHLVNEPYPQRAISSTSSSSFFQSLCYLSILSTYYLFIVSFCQLAILSTCHFIN